MKHIELLNEDVPLAKTDTLLPSTSETEGGIPGVPGGGGIIIPCPAHYPLGGGCNDVPCDCDAYCCNWHCPFNY